VILIACSIFGINSLVSATFSNLFSEVYHFTPGAVGLAYVGPGIGDLMAALFGWLIFSRIYSMVSV
jgi:hypothetical protein